MAELTFQQHMEETGAKPGYYVATIIGGNGGQAKRQRVLDHSSALFSQGFRWVGEGACEIWVGGAIRTYRFHSENGESLRAFIGTFKVGREMVQLDGHASDLDHAHRIMRDEMRTGSMQGHNVQYYGVQWKSKVDW